jgi:hypothetical protein
MPGHARVIHYAGAATSVRLYPVPDGFPFADLVSGPCGACGGTGRRDYPMPAAHPRRVPFIPAHACHDCIGSGTAHAVTGSSVAHALARGES